MNRKKKIKERKITDKAGRIWKKQVNKRKEKKKQRK